VGSACAGGTGIERPAGRGGRRRRSRAGRLFIRTGSESVDIVWRLRQGGNNYDIYTSSNDECLDGADNIVTCSARSFRRSVTGTRVALHNQRKRVLLRSLRRTSRCGGSLSRNEQTGQRPSRQFMLVLGNCQCAELELAHHRPQCILRCTSS
jgi:hypothetical protein